MTEEQFGRRQAISCNWYNWSCGLRLFRRRRNNLFISVVKHPVFPLPVSTCCLSVFSRVVNGINSGAFSPEAEHGYASMLPYSSKDRDALKRRNKSKKNSNSSRYVQWVCVVIVCSHTCAKSSHFQGNYSSSLMSTHHGHTIVTR